ncbi:putative dehydrogenase [Mycobacterium tuberculosis]|nr:putative dehydrogenase [Mycobacterium tuberculosis]
MDAGCYAVHMAHTFGGATPEVVSRKPNYAIQRSIGP